MHSALELLTENTLLICKLPNAPWRNKLQSIWALNPGTNVCEALHRLYAHPATSCLCLASIKTQECWIEAWHSQGWLPALSDIWESECESGNALGAPRNAVPLRSWSALPEMATCPTPPVETPNTPSHKSPARGATTNREQPEGNAAGMQSQEETVWKENSVWGGFSLVFLPYLPFMYVYMPMYIYLYALSLCVLVPASGGQALGFKMQAQPVFHGTPSPVLDFSFQPVSGFIIAMQTLLCLLVRLLCHLSKTKNVTWKAFSDFKGL